MENDLVLVAIDKVMSGKHSYCKSLSADACGENGVYETGILLARCVLDLFFTGEDFHNHILDKEIQVRCQNEITATCRVKRDSKTNELRLWNCDSGFPYMSPEFIGALFILIKLSESCYEAFVLNTDAEIQEFLGTFGMTPAETNRIIELA